MPVLGICMFNLGVSRRLGEQEMGGVILAIRAQIPASNLMPLPPYLPGFRQRHLQMGAPWPLFSLGPA